MRARCNCSGRTQPQVPQVLQSSLCALAYRVCGLLSGASIAAHHFPLRPLAIDWRRS